MVSGHTRGLGLYSIFIIFVNVSGNVLISFFYSCSVFSAPLIKENVFSQWNILASFVID